MDGKHCRECGRAYVVCHVCEARSCPEYWSYSCPRCQTRRKWLLPGSVCLPAATSQRVTAPPIENDAQYFACVQALLDYAGPRDLVGTIASQCGTEAQHYSRLVEQRQVSVPLAAQLRAARDNLREWDARLQRVLEPATPLHDGPVGA